MAETNWLKRNGMTTGRLALIGVLAVVLVVVLICQFGGRDGTTAAKRKPRARTATGRGASAGKGASGKTGSKPVPTHRKAKPWPVFQAHEVAAFNPFRVPHRLLTPQPVAPSGAAQPAELAQRAASQEAEAKRLDAVAALQSMGVEMIVSGYGGEVAIIGSRVVRVGDLIQGFRVKEIDVDGVTLVSAQP